MAHASDVELLVLLALRLRTLAEAEVVAGACDTTGEATGSALSSLRDGGLVRSREGRVSGWMLTPEGRDACGARLAAELDEIGARGLVADAYGRFLTVNQALLDLCTRWQLRSVEGHEIANDHGDASYDRAVLAELGPIDAVGRDVIATLESILDRFGSYAPRLAAARAAVEGGEPDWLTRPTIDSYHTVWFELHENLLATLGLERGDEVVPAPSTLQEAR